MYDRELTEIFTSLNASTIETMNEIEKISEAPGSGTLIDSASDDLNRVGVALRELRAGYTELLERRECGIVADGMLAAAELATLIGASVRRRAEH